MNTKEENSEDFYPNYVQEFGLRTVNVLYLLSLAPQKNLHIEKPILCSTKITYVVIRQIYALSKCKHKSKTNLSFVTFSNVTARGLFVAEQLRLCEMCICLSYTVYRQ